MNLEPPAKRPRPTKLNSDTCVLCNKPLPTGKGSDYKTVVRNPTIAGLNALFDAAEKRKDEVYDRMFTLKEEMFSANIQVAFHKSCRASYTSKSNLQYLHPGDDPNLRHRWRVPVPTSPERKVLHFLFDVTVSYVVMSTKKERN